MQCRLLARSISTSCSAFPLTNAVGVKRLNLGGKALTNLLKETVSYRSLDMRDEGLLMEQLKEQLCWTSQVGVSGLGVC